MKEHRAERLEKANEEALKFAELIKEPTSFQLTATAQDISASEDSKDIGEEDEQNEKEKEPKESDEKLGTR